MPIAIKVFILPILRQANQGENMKRTRNKQDTRNKGAILESRKKLSREGRAALRIAINVNESLDVVSDDERVILRGPVGGPKWLFRVKKKSEATLCERERYL